MNRRRSHQFVLRAELGQDDVGLALGVARQGAAGLKSSQQGDADNADRDQYLDQRESALQQDGASWRHLQA